MTKIEMVNKISENFSLPKTYIEKIIDEFVKITQNTLKSGDKISLTGLGIFTPKKRKARTARNPKTGAAVNVPAKKVVKFKPGKELLEIMQESAPQ
jgi:DNA-binding protein HU-beta